MMGVIVLTRLSDCILLGRFVFVAVPPVADKSRPLLRIPPGASAFHLASAPTQALDAVAWNGSSFCWIGCSIDGAQWELYPCSWATDGVLLLEYVHHWLVLIICAGANTFTPSTAEVQSRLDCPVRPRSKGVQRFRIINLRGRTTVDRQRLPARERRPADEAQALRKSLIDERAGLAALQA